MYERPGIAGSGTIACGLAACASTVGQVRLLARSDQSAWRAEEQVEKLCGKLEGAQAGKVKVTTDLAALAGSDLVIEAIVEDLEAKVALLGELAATCPDADLASSTSALSISELAKRSGRPERFFGLHVFNPPTKMELVELCFADGAQPAVRDRAKAWCEALGKSPVIVPDEIGFVVNRLLFPYLFDAVRLQERTGMPPEDVDRCMTLGAGHPMGPLALLDFVGIDVAVAIGDELHAESGSAAHEPPERLRKLADAGKLGKKSGTGFYEYEG